MPSFDFVGLHHGDGFNGKGLPGCPVDLQLHRVFIHGPQGGVEDADKAPRAAAGFVDQRDPVSTVKQRRQGGIAKLVCVLFRAVKEFDEQGKAQRVGVQRVAAAGDLWAGEVDRRDTERFRHVVVVRGRAAALFGQKTHDAGQVLFQHEFSFIVGFVW